MVDADRSGWARELRAAVALHDLAAAGARMLGDAADAGERLEQARLGVVAVCERAEAAGAGDAELDAELAAIRREQLSVLRAVEDVGRERERTARNRGHDTDRLQLGWATSADLTARLGVARRDVQPLVDHALDTDLVYRVRETAMFRSPLGDEVVGWALTPAGSLCVEAGDLRAQPRRHADAR